MALLTPAQVSDGVYALLTSSQIPSRWYSAILGGDTSFSFYDDLGLFESDQLPNLAGAARAATASAFTRRTPEAVKDVAYILGLPAPTTWDNLVDGGKTGLEEVGGKLASAGSGFLGNLGTVGKVLPWVAAALVLRKLRLL